MAKRRGGFERFTIDDYTITKDGEVINNRWNRPVKPQSNGKGYLRVCIAGKMLYVHRLVAERYVPNPNNLPQVNHIDGDKTNNKAENLEWVSNAENRRHAVEKGLHAHGEMCSNSKLNWEKVYYIREHPEIPTKELSKKFGVGEVAIRCARRGASWKSVEKIC